MLLLVAVVGMPPSWALALEPAGAPVSPASAVKADKVTGLRVDFYDFPSWVPKGIDSWDDAKRHLEGNKPTCSYTLNIRSLDFPHYQPITVNPDQITLGDFLLGPKEYERRKELADSRDKDKYEPLPARFAETVNQRSIWVFNGFVNVGKAGTYTIQAPVDDAVEIKIGGIVVHTRGPFGGMTPPEGPENVDKVTFSEPGIYPIAVTYYERDGVTGLHVYSDLDPGGEMSADGKLVLLPMMTTKLGKGEVGAVPAAEKKSGDSSNEDALKKIEEMLK